MNGSATAPTPARSQPALFASLMVATILAVAAISPALLFLLDPSRPEPLFGASGDPVPFVVGFAIANVVLSAVTIVVGLRLEPSVRVGLPLLRSQPVADRTTVLQCAGIAAGLAAVVLLCGVAFRTQLPQLPPNFDFPPVWQGILMMLGAAVREEILFRFFALNLIVWIVMRLARREQPATAMVWAGNVLISLVFVVAHLVPAAPLLNLNAVASGMAMALGTLAGMVLGWVYWRHGLIMAIFAHAVSGVLVYLGARGAVAVLS